MLTPLDLAACAHNSAIRFASAWTASASGPRTITRVNAWNGGASIERRCFASCPTKVP